MSTVFERLREALAPDLEVEEEIASGGMGIVFSARDAVLDRPVAIKILRPEQATARAAEKFLREARILANLRHPNVIPVHNAGEADGFFYYVMDLVTEKTLGERLTDGALRQNEALKLGRDLLDALEPVHDQGVVHRDIKPSNIFLISHRAVLTDFGIARPSLDPQDITATDGTVTGTIGYMPPEQAYGLTVTNRTDLYAVAMVLFEAYTGRRWSDTPPDVKPNWSGVPSRVVPVLKQALAWEPEKRWPDAASFRRALWRTRTLRYRRYKWYGISAAAATLVIGAFVGTYLFRPAPVAYDLAILPFTAGPSVDPLVAEKLTKLTGYHLDDFLDRAPSNIADKLQAQGNEVDSTKLEALRTFDVGAAAHGTVTHGDDGFAVVLRVVTQNGDWTAAGTVTFDTADLGQTGNNLGMHIARELEPNRLREYAGSSALVDHSSAAVNAFVNGEISFARHEWEAAVAHYLTAWTLDSTFVLAAVRYWNAHRWLLTGEQGIIDLEQIFEEHGDALSTRDSLIVRAALAEDAKTRYEILRTAITKYPQHSDVAFAYAEELYNRGPFSGIPLDTAAYWLAAAVEKDSSFSPAVLSLLWASIRLGHRQESQRWFSWFEQLTDSTDWFRERLDLVRFVVQQRFAPEQGAGLDVESDVAPATPDAFAKWFRVTPIFDLPRVQIALGRDLAKLPGHAANAHEGQALGLISTGHIGAAIAHFDTAATLFGTPKARLEAAEWRVIPAVLGMPGISVRETEFAVNVLERTEGDSAIGVRAAWALGINAALTGELLAAERRLEQIRGSLPDVGADRLSVSLDAVIQGARGRLEQAVQISDAALAWDSAGQGGDPFATTVLHLQRAVWLENLGEHEQADASRLWYEHANIDEFVEEARAAEIDWAFGTFARWQRGIRAEASGDRRAACKHLPRVIELWEFADEAFAPLRDSAQVIVENLRCSQ